MKKHATKNKDLLQIIVYIAITFKVFLVVEKSIDHATNYE